MPFTAFSAPRCESVHGATTAAQRSSYLAKAGQLLKNFVLKPEASGQLRRSADQISYMEFKDIQRIVRQILKLFPADQHVYVGLGRSPSVFTAYLRALGFQNVLNLPLSSMRNHPTANQVGILNRRFSSELSPVLQQKLWSHFERFLPSGEELQGRGLVLMDYAQSGASLVSAQHYISEFYLSKGFDVEVKVLPVVDPDFKRMLVDALIRVPRVEIGSQALKRSFQDELYDDSAEYGKYDIRDRDRRALVRNTHYEDLIEEFARREELSEASP